MKIYAELIIKSIINFICNIESYFLYLHMFNLFKTKYKNFPKESGIYKITTLHNNKSYIGSALSLKKRLKDHRNYLKRNKHHANYLQNVYNNYGEDNFIVEFIFISNKNFKLNSNLHRKLIVLEEIYINKYNSEYNTIKTPTTQINNPATSIKVYQYTMNGEFIKEWESGMEVIRHLNIQPQNSLKGSNRSSGGFRWSNIKHDKLPKYKAKQGTYASKKISCYDLFGKKLQTFDSISDCARILFPNLEFNKIRQSIDKYSKDSRALYGYRFCLGEKEVLDNSINLTHRINFIILQYDKNMNFIKIWESISQAQKALNITSIYDNLSGKTKQSGGFIWKKLS